MHIITNNYREKVSEVLIWRQAIQCKLIYLNAQLGPSPHKSLLYLPIIHLLSQLTLKETSKKEERERDREI